MGTVRRSERFLDQEQTIGDLLFEGKRTLEGADIPDAWRQARDLLTLAIKKDAVFIIAHPEYRPTPNGAGRFREFLRRRAAHEPFQQIRGLQEFYGIEFIVNGDVMIPRPETELAVEAALEKLSLLEKPIFCDIGTGSGCIAVAILHCLKNASGTATDISKQALAVAARNADQASVSDRLELVESDVFSALGPRVFDLVISNPPYVPASDVVGLQAEVREFEPLVALTDGSDGLSIISRIIGEAPMHLEPDGFLVLEIGFNQSETVTEMLVGKGWREIEYLPDLQGIPRIARARVPES